MTATPQEIAALEKALNSGAHSMTYDGRTTTFKSDEDMRRRLRELKEELALGAPLPAYLSIGGRRTIVSGDRNLGYGCGGADQTNWH